MPIEYFLSLRDELGYGQTLLRFTPSRASHLVLLKTYLRYIQAKWRFPKMVCGWASIQLHAGKMHYSCLLPW